MEAGLLLIRVVLGGIMAAHGAQKLFGWFGGHGIPGTAGWLESMGLRPARLYAAVNGLAEFGGGALLVLGLLTPLGAAAVAGVMFVAIATVHWKNGFFNSSGGYEFNLLIVATAIGLAMTGPGTISIDHLAGWTLAGPEWGLAALGISAIAAGSVLAMRTPPARAGARRHDK
ncbi:MAG: DoxX family protein [Gaiellales bacterium]